MSKRATRLAIALALATAGCSGSDGAQGPQGPQGLPGQNGGTGPTGPVGPPNYNPFTAGEAVATPTSVAVTGTDVVIKFNVKVDGVNRNDFIEKASAPGGVAGHNEDAWWVYDATAKAGTRTKITPFASASNGTWTLASNGSGNYTATIPGLAAAALQPGTTFMLSTRGSNSETATVVAFLGAPTHDVVSDQACVNCHGAHVWRGAAHDVTNPYGVGPCVVCHNRTGSADPRLAAAGSGLMGIVHGVHNSHNMAAGMGVDVDPSPAVTAINNNVAGQFIWTWASNGNKFKFSVGFPTYMQNCSICHDSPARLAAVYGSPVSWSLCMSCHNDWNGFTGTQLGGAVADTHRDLDKTANCGQCHTGARATIANYHDGLETERAGLLVGGEDLSLVLGKKFKINVVGVADNGTDTTVTWNVVDPTNANTTYDACNADFAAGPVFFGYAGGSEPCTGTAAGCSSNFSILRAYATGDDWVENTNTSSPGQPDAVNVTTTNTTCTGDVASTIIPSQAVAATRAQLSIQGKPQLNATVKGATVKVWARTPSPVYQYAVGTGAALAARRQIVSNDKCLACHPGSLYQHGGNRVDQVELCIMCHNPASNEKNVRVGYGVAANEAYDGKQGQTYDLRTMVHAIHSAGESANPYVIYRSRGIYAFYGAAVKGEPAMKAIPNWPGAGTQTIFGSSPAKTQTHNEIVVHYPRSLGACGACHVGGSELLVDPAKAVAVTDEDAGSQSADPAIGWASQLDDVLVGPTTQACLSCHLGSNGKTQVEQAQLKGHVQQFSWQWAAFPGGRADLLDGSPIETCFVCHDVSLHR